MMVIGPDLNAAAVHWLEEVLKAWCGGRGKRIARITLTRRDFVHAGTLFKCGNGPWRETLIEAIAANQPFPAAIPLKAEGVSKTEGGNSDT